MINVPKINLGLIAVSRDCFPIQLSRERKKKVMAECKKKKVEVTQIDTIIEGETDIQQALQEVRKKKIDALVIYLGNFGPEGPTTMLAQRFGGPVMLVSAAEETQNNLTAGRGDAFCGMLSASYNLGLRNQRVYIPEYPVGTASEIAERIEEFLPVARIINGLKGLKILSFGPRPQDFFTCHAPLKPLYDLGVEIMENSELDLYDIFLSAEGDPKIREVVKEMEEELGKGNTYPQLIKKLAQYEVALNKFYEENLGASQYGVFANKCWPAFERYFGFVPCFVNSRLASRGIPVSCECDIYGVLSQYMATCATGLPATLLDLNNTVPKDMFEEIQKSGGDYDLKDLFMGFHCGNTPSSCLVDVCMKYQLIMNRLLEAGQRPEITR